MREPEDVSAMLRLYELGWGAKRIAAELGVSRNTVRRYLRQGGWAGVPQPPAGGGLGATRDLGGGAVQTSPGQRRGGTPGAGRGVGGGGVVTHGGAGLCAVAPAIRRPLAVAAVGRVMFSDWIGVVALVADANELGNTASTFRRWKSPVVKCPPFGQRHRARYLSPLLHARCRLR
jgi:hypothetical protein